MKASQPSGTSSTIAAIDLGATRIKAGLVVDGIIRTSTTTVLGPDDKTQEGIVLRLDAVFHDLCARGNVDPAAISAIGIGAAGATRNVDGIIAHSPNFPAWSEFPLRRLLAQRLGLPVHLDNDANALTLGEARFGAGRGYRDFVCLTLGSGVGGGLFLNGQIYRGAFGMAGELGHITVVPEGFPCNCGNRGCLEQYASATGLRNLVRRDALFGGLTDTALADPDLPRRLFEAARAGDPRCRAYFDEFGYHLAIGIGTILQVLNVRLVILAGGLARALPAFGPRLMAELPGRGYPCVNSVADVVPCALWEDGGVLGAAALVDEAQVGKS